jgi:hypothetical protein
METSSESSPSVCCPFLFVELADDVTAASSPRKAADHPPDQIPARGRLCVLSVCIPSSEGVMLDSSISQIEGGINGQSPAPRKQVA